MAPDLVDDAAAVRQLPSAAELHAALAYDPEMGLFTWRPRADVSAKWRARYASKPAGTIDREGYVIIKINGRRYMAHRIAWAMVAGEWPADQIDHANRDKADNRIANLRQATRGQNQANTASRGRTGQKGVYARGKRWAAMIWRDGRQHYLSTFDTIEGASAAFRAAHRAQHGDFSDQL